MLFRSMPAACRWYPAFPRNFPTAAANHPCRPAFPALLPVAAQDGLAELVEPARTPLFVAAAQPLALAQVREPVQEPQAQAQPLEVAELRAQQLPEHLPNLPIQALDQEQALSAA